MSTIRRLSYARGELPVAREVSDPVTAELSSVVRTDRNFRICHAGCARSVGACDALLAALTAVTSIISPRRIKSQSFSTQPDTTRNPRLSYRDPREDSFPFFRFNQICKLPTMPA